MVGGGAVGGIADHDVLVVGIAADAGLGTAQLFHAELDIDLDFFRRWNPATAVVIALPAAAIAGALIDGADAFERLLPQSVLGQILRS